MLAVARLFPVFLVASAATSSSVALADDLVQLDYPEPTPVCQVAADAAAWVGKPVIMDRNCTAKVQIFAAQAMDKGTALKRLGAALTEVGLTAIDSDGVLVVVPTRLASSVKPLPPPPPLTGDGPIRMTYDEPTEVTDLVRDVSEWSGRAFLVDRGASRGKFQMISAQPLPRRLAYAAFRRTLDLLGYGEGPRGPVTLVAPKYWLARPEHAGLGNPASLATLPAGLSGTVSMDFPGETDMREIVRQVAGWSGKTIIADRNVNGKVQIFASGELPKADAYRVFLAALDILGLTALDDDGATRIIPLAAIRR